VPDTSVEARAALAGAADAWQSGPDGAGVQWAHVRAAPPGHRWVVVRTTTGEERARATLARQAEQTRQTWQQQRWHLGNRRFACEADAREALAQQLKKRPEWLTVHSQVVAHPKHPRPGRPRADAVPDRQDWQIEATIALDDEALTREGQRKASFLIATNVLDPNQLTDFELIQTYKDQGSVERGFAFPEGSAVSRLF
jgi:transposase